jgi:hypothetical protein
MRKSVSHAGAVTLTLALSLGGCGSDGGGSVGSANTTPPASNASLANLVASQSFANNAASETSTIAASANLTAASSVSQALTFSYDLTTNSYTVSTQGHSQTFAPANLSSPAANGVAVYAITNGATTDRLTLESASITGYGATYPQYSGLGYWQRTTTGASSSDVTVDFFIYGLPTSASAVPRSGSAAYATSVYGVVSPIGSEERFFQGTGRMDIDFKAGLMSTSATLSESGIVSQASYGSTATINGSGTLSSSGNAFSGAITYTGLNSKSTGTLQGQFYGPAAQELGASFATSGADGSSASGVIWGNQNANLAPLNQSVSNIVTTQTFTSSEVQSPSGTIDTGQVTVTSAGGVTVSPAGLPGATFTSSQEVSGAPANFTGYGNGTTTVDLYKAGSANTELALTYLSFGSWQGPIASGSNTTATAWFAYGLGTSAAVIQARTGSANYTGVAYGTASTAASGTNAMVSGTASFAVNFDMNGYFGSFGLKNATTDYGTFNVSGTIGSGTANRGGVTGVTAGSGTFLPAFYGPTGQEFGGPFQIAVPGTTIVGVAAGKGG